MQHTHSSTGSRRLRRLTQPWRSCRMWRWQRQTAPRFAAEPEHLPRFVRSCRTTQEAIGWLRFVDWPTLPHARSLCFGRTPIPTAAYIGAFLVKLDYQMPTMAQLRRFLVAHPALVWALGFPLPPADNHLGFDVEAAVPSARHLNRVLRELPPDLLHRLLDSQVRQVKEWCAGEMIGETIAVDTKHILAWVKENNPKQFIEEGRFDKTRQPSGDPDCKLGCKRRHNQRRTPSREGMPADGLPAGKGEYYWGYASAAAVTRLSCGHEFVLAELTQTFDKGDITCFFPLMAQTERRLGYRPRYAALDAAFDAFYVYDYFYDPDHDGFAAVPFGEKGQVTHRAFDENGLPLCTAGLAMPCKFTYQDRTNAIIPYRRAKHVCPLFHPQASGTPCPIGHKQWTKGGCSTSLADTPGARIRHQLDRHGEEYLSVYRQRTAVERIFSQALELGIERPKLRNQQAIANQNTLIYLLINLRTLRRIAPEDAVR